MFYRKNFMHNTLYASLTALISLSILLTAPKSFPVPQGIFLATQPELTTLNNTSPVPILTSQGNHSSLGVVRILMHLKSDDSILIKRNEEASIEKARLLAAEKGADGFLPMHFSAQMRGKLSASILVGTALKENN